MSTVCVVVFVVYVSCGICVYFSTECTALWFYAVVSNVLIGGRKQGRYELDCTLSRCQLAPGARVVRKYLLGCLGLGFTHLLVAVVNSQESCSLIG